LTINEVRYTTLNKTSQLLKMLLSKNLIISVVSPISLLTITSLTVFTTAAQAQEIRTLQDYLNNCISEDEDEIPEQCDRLREANESKLEEEAEEMEETEESEKVDAPPEKTQKSGGIGGYAGAVLGVYFPDIDENRPIFTGEDIDVQTGFGSGLFAGIKLNRYFGTDLEFNVLAGEIDSDLDDDQTYVMSGIFLNPRFTLPLNERKNSLALFLSPGIGISQLSASVEDEISSDTEEDDDEDLDRTTITEDDSRFTWQIKGGVSIPVSSKFSVIPQLRYASQTGDNAVDYFGTEVGVKFDF
jgi:opacity protein-like surface antigen